MVAHYCNPSTYEVESRGSWVQDHSQLHRKFKASPSHMRPWPGFLSIAVINTMTKSNLGGKGGYRFQSIIEGGQGRSLKQKPMEECCFQNGGTFSLLGYLSYIAQAHLPREGTTYSGLGLSTSVSSKDNNSQVCLQANLMEAIPQLRLLLLGRV